jgi:PAS domain S-box-containing protein
MEIPELNQCQSDISKEDVPAIKVYSRQSVPSTEIISINKLFELNSCNIELLGSALEYSTDAIFIYNTATYKFFFVNKQASLSLGYTKEEMYCLTVWDIDPNITDTVSENIKQLLTSQTAISFESKHKRKDGSVFPVRISSVKFDYDEDQYVVNHVRDITGEKKYKENLNIFAYALNNASDAFFIRKLHEISFIYVNDKACRHLNYEKDELLNLTIFDIAPFFTSDQLSEIEKKIVSSDRFVIESVCKRKNGSKFPVECTLSYFQYDDVCYVFTILRDITEQKQTEKALRDSEQRYREIFNYSHDGIFLLEVTDDMRFRNIIFNPALEKSTGLKNAVINGKFIEETTSPENVEKVNERYLNCVKTKEAILDTEIELNLSSGTRTFLSSLIPIPDNDGKIHRLLGISRDITEKKKAFKELKKSQDSLNKAELIAKLGHLEFDYINKKEYWSNGAYEILNIPVGIEKNCKEFIDRIHPDDKDRVIKALDKTIKEYVKFDEIYKFVDFKGIKKIIHSTGSVHFTKEGLPVKYLGVLQDITTLYDLYAKIDTEKKKFEMLAESSPIGIILFADNIPVYANSSFFEMSESSTLSKICIDNIKNTLYQEDLKVVNYLEEYLKDKKDIKQPLKYTLRRKAGSTGCQYFDVYITVHSQNSVQYIQVIIVDNTENYENERIRNQLAANILYMEQKDRFTEKLQSLINSILSKNLNYKESDFKTALELLKTYSQADKDWIFLNYQIEQIFPDFFVRLKNICPSLSSNEIRHCICIKLNLETKEIARLFSVKPESIQISRKRLKKKLKLSGSVDLRSFVVNL